MKNWSAFKGEASELPLDSLSDGLKILSGNITAVIKKRTECERIKELIDLPENKMYLTGIIRATECKTGR